MTFFQADDNYCGGGSAVEFYFDNLREEDTEMKKLQKLSATTAMVFVLTCSTFAGDLGSDRMVAGDLGSDVARAGDLGSDRAQAGDLGSDVATYVMDWLYTFGIL